MRRLSRARLFFLELVLDLIFFFLCVGVCLMVFAQAARFDRDGRALDHAVLLAQSTAETYRAVNGDLDALSQRLELDSSGRRYYDQDWTPTAQATFPGYYLDVVPVQTGVLSTLSVTVTRQEQMGRDTTRNTQIYQLPPIHLYSGEVTP